MNKQGTIEIYNRRVDAAVEYIDSHLDEELELATVAAAANFSPFHFHRIFRAFRGEPLGTYVTRRRVEKATRLLESGDLSVETIAYMVGFGAPSSLTKAFQRFYGISPTEYRTDKITRACFEFAALGLSGSESVLFSSGSLAVGTPTPPSPNEKNPRPESEIPSVAKLKQPLNVMKNEQTNRPVALEAPRIVELEPQTALCVAFKGDYKQLDYPGAFAKLWAAVKRQGLHTAGIEHVSVFHNDPKVTDAADLSTDVCLTVHKPAVPEDGIEVKTIAGGRYAVFTHAGPYDESGAVYDAIYGEWVPANCPCKEECVCGENECACGCKPGEPCMCPPDECRCALRDEPVFEKYLNDPEKTAPEKLETEIYIPIK